MAHFCRDLPQVMVKDEDGQGVFKMVLWVPPEMGVSVEAFKIFRKAIYLGGLSVPDFKTWLMVRRLAKYYGCDMMMLEKCDGDAVAVPLSLANCSSIFDKTPKTNELKQRALKFIKTNVKTLIDTDESLEWSEKLWRIVLCSNDLSPPVPSEDDLFTAALKWQEKKEDRVDVDKFRQLFKSLFRYPLMTEEFLWSKTFRESRILEDGELIKLYSEKRGLEESNFDRVRRCSSPNYETALDDTFEDQGFGLDQEYVWSLGSCHTSTQTDGIFTSTPLEGCRGAGAGVRFDEVDDGDSSTDHMILLSKNEKQKRKKSKANSQRKRRYSRSQSLLGYRSPTTSGTMRTIENNDSEKRPRPSPSPKHRSGRMVSASSSSEASTSIEHRVAANSGGKRPPGNARGKATAWIPNPRRSQKDIPHATTSPKTLKVVRKRATKSLKKKEVGAWPGYIKSLLALNHLPPEPTKCLFGCGRTFPSAAERMGHERIVHKGLTKCYFCPKIFSQEGGAYMRHLLVHTRERPFYCDGCAKEFGDSYYHVHRDAKECCANKRRRAGK